jgi:hypothetical protein
MRDLSYHLFDINYNRTAHHINSPFDNICKICFNSDQLNNLISPCLCDGLIRYVHRNCHNIGRIDSNKKFYTCDMCDYVYKFEPILMSKCYQKLFYIKYIITFALEFLFYISIFQAMLVGVTYLSIKLDKNEYIWGTMNMHDKFLVYYIFTNILFSILMGVYGLIKNYSILGHDSYICYIHPSNTNNKSLMMLFCIISIIFLGIYILAGIPYSIIYMIKFQRRRCRTIYLYNRLDKYRVKNTN